MTSAAREELDALARRLDAGRPPRPGLSYAGYVLFHLLFGPILGMRGIARAMKRGYARGMLRRALGGDPPPPSRPKLILCGGSLGEVRVAARIASLIREQRGIESAILAGCDDALMTPPKGIFLGWIPFNNPLAAALFLRRWKPAAILTVEFHDIHHLKAQANLRGVRQIVFNVPTTEEEAERVIRKREQGWRWTAVDGYLTRGEAHAERLRRMGVPQDRIAATGAIGLIPDAGEPLTRAALSIPPTAFLVVAGSTYPVEEAILLRAHARLRKVRPDAVLLLAPRHLKRPEALPPGARRSSGGGPDASGVLVLDTYGELRAAYAEADLAYVGGTFGMTVGGHTPVEAIAWGVPVVHGPNRAQHDELLAELTACGAAKEVEDEDRLVDHLAQLATDSDALARARAGAAGFADGSSDPTLPVFDALIAPVLARL